MDYGRRGEAPRASDWALVILAGSFLLLMLLAGCSGPAGQDVPFVAAPLRAFAAGFALGFVAGLFAFWGRKRYGHWLTGNKE